MGAVSKMVPCTPPRLVASILLTRVGEWRFPQISGIVTAPTLRRDGSLITNPGYDPKTRLYYMADPGLHVPMIFARAEPRGCGGGIAPA